MMSLKKWAFIAVLGCGLSSSVLAQRSFIGAGVGLLSLNYPGSDVKISGLTTHLTYSRYSSPRRGMCFDVSPLMALKAKYTDFDNKTVTQKLGGISLGYSVFGLIGSDYQSKMEVGLINTLRADILNNYATSNFYMSIGAMVRYKLNSKMKLALDINPLTIGSNIGGMSLGPTTAVRFFYAP